MFLSTHGVEESIELVGWVEAGGFGQRAFFDDLGPRLDLPDDLQFFAQTVILNGGKGEQVLRAAEGGLQDRNRQRAGQNVVDDPLPGADADKLALFGWVGRKGSWCHLYLGVR